jgi:hypothetical protein
MDEERLTAIIGIRTSYVIKRHTSGIQSGYWTTRKPSRRSGRDTLLMSPGKVVIEMFDGLKELTKEKGVDGRRTHLNPLPRGPTGSGRRWDDTIIGFFNKG